MSSTGIEIRERARDGVHTIELAGELDITAVPSLEAEVRHLCEGERARDLRGITLDLGGLQFIDSTGIAAIVLVSRICAKHGYAFALLEGPRSVQRLFETTGLIDELPFRERELADESPAGRG